MNFMYTDEMIDAVVTDFFNTQCILNPESKGATHNEMYAAYCFYARGRGIPRLRMTGFSMRVRKHFTHITGEQRRRWSGIDLKVSPF